MLSPIPLTQSVNDPQEGGFISIENKNNGKIKTLSLIHDVWLALCITCKERHQHHIKPHDLDAHK
jgi:hypothetical protein